jgi:hypothetical protein
MGHYFYASPLLTYSNSATEETTPVNVTSGLASNTFSDPVIFSNNNVISTLLNNTYANSISQTVTAKNQTAATTTSSAATIQAIVDGPSYTLITTTLPLSLPNATANTIGYHVSSGTADSMNVPPYNNGGTPYANTPYSNTQDITNTQELQISNGTFTTPLGQPYSYLNYTPYYYTSTLQNTVDYSNPSSWNGYRFVTFAWRLPAPVGGTYNTLSFKMLNTTPQLVNTGGIAYTGISPIYLYYRFEDAANSAPTNTSSISSAWLNGNSLTGTPTGSGNYYIASTAETPYYALTGLTIAPTNTTFNVYCLTNTITTQTVNLYCRIGLPMDRAISFSSISATISS